MPWHDLPLPPAIARLIELLLQAVGRGARQASRLLGDGHLIRTRMIVRRVSAILRHVILMLAVRLTLAPARTRVASTPSDREPPARKPCFSLWSSIPTACHSEGAQRHSESVNASDLPAIRNLSDGLRTLNGATRLQGDGGGDATIQKQLLALRAALENPLRLARRLARKLRGDGIFLAPKVPRTIPKTSEREFWEELITSAEEARFAFGEYWRLRRDTS